LTPPLSPSIEDVEIYKKNLLNGSTLLLGSTKELLGICDQALDIDPVYPNEKIIIGDWLDNKDFYTNIIGDGILNFSDSLCHELLDMAEKNCNNFIVRAFNYKMPIMKIAQYFPTEESFKSAPQVMYQNKEYSFFKWTFGQIKP
jgi:hypothetical protein